MLLVNFIGAPGEGKTTMAAGVYHRLKTAHWNVELVTEYTKELILTGDHWSLSDELLVFTQKYKRIKKMSNVDIVITDSPLLNSVLYGREQFGTVGGEFFAATAMKFDSIYFNVERQAAYVPVGRIADEKMADQAGVKLLDILKLLDIPYTSVHGHDEAIATVVMQIENETYKRGITKLTERDTTETVESKYLRGLKGIPGLTSL